MSLMITQAMLICLCIVFCEISEADITTLEELKVAIINGPNRKVGIVADYMLHETYMLPDITEIIICGAKNPIATCSDEYDLMELVNNGTVVAGFLAQYSDSVMERFHAFSSGKPQMNVFLFAPDKSREFPHGAPLDRSSFDLYRAFNAAILRFVADGKNIKLKKKYFQKFGGDVAYDLSIHSCKSHDYKLFPVPNKNMATGLLKRVLESKVLKMSIEDWILRLNESSLDWQLPLKYLGDQVNAVMNEFRKLSGPDGEVYGSDIVVEGLTRKGSQYFSDPYLYSLVLDGSVHVSAPYHTLDEVYTGTQEPCQDNSDCRPASIQGGTEICNRFTTFYGEPVINKTTGERLKRCELPQRALFDIFRYSCTMLSTDNSFFTRKTEAQTDGRKLTAVAMWTGLAIPTVVCIVSLILLIILIWFEKSGKALLKEVHLSS